MLASIFLIDLPMKEGPIDRLEKFPELAWSIKKIMLRFGRVIGFDKLSLHFSTLNTLKFLIATQHTKHIDEDNCLCLDSRDYVQNAGDIQNTGDRPAALSRI